MKIIPQNLIVAVIGLIGMLAIDYMYANGPGSSFYLVFQPDKYPGVFDCSYWFLRGKLYGA
jgi:hypothetical protein